MPADFMNIAHRGASAYCPENTLAAFIKAINTGIKYIECDIRLSKDGHLVVIHDKKIDRTTNGKGIVSDFNLTDLKKLDAGLWFGPKYKDERIPTLSEVFDLLEKYKDIKLVLEIKDSNYFPEITEKAVNMIKKRNMINRVNVSAFYWDVLEKVKKIEKNIETSALIEFSTKKDYFSLINDGAPVNIYNNINNLIKDATKFNVNVVCPPACNTDEEIIKMLHENSFKVRLWGVGENIEDSFLRKLIKWRIDGLTINDPYIVEKLLN
ncbi:MAG: glycerophosphodiester phosphodiesterase family protein [Atribacterota bacterium]|nr:glycerophosphodiester phosphodiesterase family protein [Atribacterota bacterium]